MSVYNESESELTQAVDSILNQSYTQLELIVVLDNPGNSKQNIILLKYVEQDDRVKLIVNDSNLGLAKSLNRALATANGFYIARMDADDISENNRIEKQVQFLYKNPAFSLVASDKFDIDATGNEISSKYKVPRSSEAIERMLNYRSVIIHPSVMILKSVLVQLGGYRNFGAAQDYDLWLRLIEIGYKIHVLDEKLIRYRNRSNNISNSNPYKQLLHLRYIRKLAQDRKRWGFDDFSEENLNQYLESHGLFDIEKVKKFNTNFFEYQFALGLINNKKFFVGAYKLMKTFIVESALFIEFIDTLKFKLVLEKINI
jgi:glycosyltransferase involved in cell wall biosynthesis